jgi:hypothetical protein
MTRASAQARLEESRQAQFLEPIALLADIGRRIVLRTPAGQRRENACLLCRYGPVPLRQQPCRHAEFFAISDGAVPVDTARLKELLGWLAPRLMRRNGNGAAATEFCLFCTMGLKQFQEERTLGPRQRCPHARIWEIAGYTPRIL